MKAVMSGTDQMIFMDDPKTNRTETIYALPDAQDNIFCPIRLLLIVALRTGNVEANSINALLSKTFSRKKKTIKWMLRRLIK